MKYLILFSLFALSSVSAQTSIAAHKVVFQMSTSDPEEQLGVISNLENLKKGWGNTVQIEVVAHGPGLTFLMKDKSAAAEGILKMIKEGVVFLACENTMTKKNISKAQLLEGVGTVPMGIAEVIQKQEQGWSYIKGNF